MDYEFQEIIDIVQEEESGKYVARVAFSNGEKDATTFLKFEEYPDEELILEKANIVIQSFNEKVK